ncbi:MAG: ABC transporter ATP-binding protein [Phyllobacterium sp.]
MAKAKKTAVLDVKNIAKRFGRDSFGGLKDIDLTIHAGETLALVGSSGSGKTTLAKLVMRLTEPDMGSVSLNGVELTKLHGRALRTLRSRFQMVFQDPLAAFNPKATVGRILEDPLRLHAIMPKEQIASAVASSLERVGLTADMAARSPRDLSGGQRQRVAIARAIATKPDLIVLDEPVSALDVSVRAQILNLLHDLQKETGVAYLFISHDLAVVRATAHRMAVMDQGRIVETGEPDAVLMNPQAEPTRVLVDAVPRLVIHS